MRFITLILVSIHLLLPTSTSGQRLSFTLNEKGLSSLNYDNVKYIQDPAYGEFGRYGIYCQLRTKGDSTYQSGSSGSYKLNNSTQQIVRTYEWGNASCQYKAKGNDRLNIVITITNTTPDLLTSITIPLFNLVFPSIPKASVAGIWTIPLHKQPMWADSYDQPSVLLMDDSIHTLALCSDESPMRDFKIGVPNMYKNKQEYVFRLESFEKLEPGKTTSFAISLRFGPSKSTGKKLAGDVYKRFTNAFPSQIEWQDRRVIGNAFLSSRPYKPQILHKNPRGWFNGDENTDVTTDAGKENFRKRLLDYANQCISHMKELNAQGIIVWDIEGQEFRNIVFVGDPTKVAELAPEMEWKGAHKLATVDEFFQKFINANFRVGVCIRPNNLENKESGYVQLQTKEPGQVLMDKISYAKKRWGCTLFYIDSNVNKQKGARYNLMDALIFKRVHEAYPDVLLIPEAQNAKYYAYSAPYDELRRGVAFTPSGIRAIFPKAFSVINISDGNPLGNRKLLIEAAKNGDILMCPVWYNSQNTIQTKSIISEVKHPSYVKRKAVNK